MKILFYTPINFQCRDVSSLILELQKCGHHVILLSQVAKGSLHDFLEEKSISTYCYTSTIRSESIRIISHVAHLIFFCWKHKVDVIFSHLEPTNLIAVLSQYFIMSRVIIFRHHLDLARLSKFDTSLAYRLTYKMAQSIITVSSRSKHYMSLVEKIDSQKIFHINLGYDFNLYPEVDKKIVDEIKARYKADILLIVLGRLDKLKRPEIAIDVMEALVYQYGLNAKLIFLGTGDLHSQLKIDVKNKALCNSVFFLGFVENVLDYLSAGDFLFHPSISESSSVAIKEAALVNLPVITCRNVGDFDEYLKDGINSFTVNHDKAAAEAALVIFNHYKNRKKLQLMSFKLKEEILKRFSIENVLPQYLKIISEA